ncbi:unnamed protein product [Moneuplotes crassus]|uniref:Uncharacterized protein n=1 Tax=Euplotes crassus TaxID=5936 RepID=A0AAD1Y954_EUPCR|nr:unnamed protein product [Moneuplotes crassus]
MCVICNTSICQNKSTEYCQDHQKPVCVKCKYDLHFKCKVEHLISTEELEYHVRSLERVVQSTHKAYVQFGLEEFHPGIGEILEKTQTSFINLKESALVAIQNKEYMLFNSYEAKLNDLRAMINEDPKLNKIMSDAFQLCILKQNQAEVFNMSKNDDKPNWQAKQNTADSMSYTSQPQENTNKTKCSINDEVIEEPTSLDQLKLKYFKEDDRMKYEGIYGLHPSTKSDADFMDESIQKKVVLPKTKKFVFSIYISCLSLLKDYIETCIPEDFCEELTLQTSGNHHYIIYKKFAKTIKKMLQDPPKILIFKKVWFTHNELCTLREMIETSGTKLRLEDCELTSDWQSYPQRISLKDKDTYCLDSVTTTK